MKRDSPEFREHLRAIGFKKGEEPRRADNSAGRFKKGHIGFKGMLGKYHSEETRRIISIKNKGRLMAEKNPNWKGGQKKLYLILRGISNYYIWRSEVFKRDNWTCQTCGRKGCHLEAHHNKRFPLILEANNIKTIEEARICKELWDINNGVTLCTWCHNLTKQKNSQGNFPLQCEIKHHLGTCKVCKRDNLELDYYGYCFDCYKPRPKKERYKEWYDKNRGTIKLKSHQHYEKNKEIKLQKQKERRLNDSIFRERNINYLKNLRIKALKEGLCTYCGGERDNPPLKTCSKCRTYCKLHSNPLLTKERSRRNSLKKKQKRAINLSQGLCAYCGKDKEDSRFIQCSKCRKYRLSIKRGWPIK